MMKTIIKTLILLAAILLVGACKNKPSKSNQLVVKTDTLVVDTPKFDLTSVVAPSLAKEIERTSAYLDTVGREYFKSVPRSGDVIEVEFYKDGDTIELIAIRYNPIYDVYKYTPLPNSWDRKNHDKNKPMERIEYMKFYFIYKQKMLAFYNLGEQSVHGDFVDSTKLIKGRPARFLSDMQADTIKQDFPYRFKLLQIHSMDSLETLVNFLER